MAVRNIQCVGGDDGLLLPPARAFRFRSPLTVTAVTEDVSPGMQGNGQSVRAYHEIGLSTPQVPPSASAPQIVTSSTTPAALFTFEVPTGYNAAVEFTVSGHCTAGTPAGKRVWTRLFYAFVNTGGTPALSTGTPDPANDVLWEVDEASGGITANITGSFAANSVTMQVTGSGSQTVHWGVVVQSISLFKE